MGIREYAVRLTGMAPGLLMHRDNIDWRDTIEEWWNDPANVKKSKRGDDRVPAFTWIGSVYHDGEHLALPADMIASCLMGGGALVPVPKGTSGKTFKSQSQSGMMSREAFWSFESNGKAVPYSAIEAMMALEKIKQHQEACRALGFELFLKRARIGQAKHLRVRPLFRSWSATGVLSVWDDTITTELLVTILGQAGEYKGLGDWRPGAKTSPGPYGRFKAEVKKL